MPRYIDATEIKLTSRDKIFVDAQFFDGTYMEGLEPHRLFPMSGPNRYVALMDAQGEAVCIIPNIDDLMPQSREVISSALNEYYMIPKIKKVIKWNSHYGAHIWTVETNHGLTKIEIIDSSNHVKRLYDDRVLIKDGADNRYEIPNINNLDARSIKLITPDI